MRIMDLKLEYGIKKFMEVIYCSYKQVVNKSK